MCRSNYDLYDVLENPEWPASCRGNRRRRRQGPVHQPGQAVLPEARVKDGTKGKLVEYYLSVAEPDGGPAARPAGPSAALPRRHRRRGDLPETGPAEASRLSGDLHGDVSVRPHRRRAEGDPSVGDRLGRADGHRHAAPVAGAVPGHRASRRAAHRPGPAARHRVRGGRATIAVDVLKPLLDELGLVGYPKTSGGRGVHVFLRIATDWDFIAVRRAGIALAREVERRAPDAVTTSWWKEERGQADLHRLQPERTRPHLRVGVLGAQDADRHSVDTADAGPSWPTPTPTTTPWPPCRTWSPAGAIRGPASTTDAQSIEPLLEMVDADEERGPRRPAVSAELPEDAGRAAARAAQQEGRRELGRGRQPPGVTDCVRPRDAVRVLSMMPKAH